MEFGYSPASKSAGLNKETIQKCGTVAEARRKKSPENTVRILHVEDSSMVATVVKETLEVEGWEVETCADGSIALDKIVGDGHYDLLLLDNSLPGINGLQLVMHARNLAHRRSIPIVMFSVTLDEAAGHLAGADACLRKPEDIALIGQTIRRLLGLAEEQKSATLGSG